MEIGFSNGSMGRSCDKLALLDITCGTWLIVVDSCNSEPILNYIELFSKLLDNSMKVLTYRKIKIYDDLNSIYFSKLEIKFRNR